MGAISVKAAGLILHRNDTYSCYFFNTDDNEAARANWFRACASVADSLQASIPVPYRTRTFSGIIGDIKALSPKQALSLFSRKKGLGAQYAVQYLRTGIDGGYGYQACASTALSGIISNRSSGLIGNDVLDVGCAVGVTAGVLGFERVTGFDLFIDLVNTAHMLDKLTGKHHTYSVADMTCDWPFGTQFDTVVCGLVCHHLKTQADTTCFFNNANRVLRSGGTLVITLPSGSVATARQFQSIVNGLESFGFKIDAEYCGMVVSDDDSHSLFWMFQIIANKYDTPASHTFIDQNFSFPLYRTPVTRETKSKQARRTVMRNRKVRHTRFKLIPLSSLETAAGGYDQPLIFERIKAMVGNEGNKY